MADTKKIFVEVYMPTVNTASELNNIKPDQITLTHFYKSNGKGEMDAKIDEDNLTDTIYPELSKSKVEKVEKEIDVKQPQQDAVTPNKYINNNGYVTEIAFFKNIGDTGKLRHQPKNSGLGSSLKKTPEPIDITVTYTGETNGEKIFKVESTDTSINNENAKFMTIELLITHSNKILSTQKGGQNKRSKRRMPKKPKKSGKSRNARSR